MRALLFQFNSLFCSPISAAAGLCTIEVHFLSASGKVKSEIGASISFRACAPYSPIEGARQDGLIAGRISFFSFFWECAQGKKFGRPR